MIIPKKLRGDCRELLPLLPAKSVHTAITSPPYWRLRTYLPAGHPDKAKEIGSEKTIEEYIADIVEAFHGLTSKNIFLLPARVALALQADGWILRSMCPWIKRNVYPESVKDRPPVAIEYVFMFSKSAECFYDRFPLLIPSSPNTHPKNSRFNETYRDLANSRPGPKSAEPGQRIRANHSFDLAIKGNDPPVRMRRNSDWFMESFQGLLLDSAGDPMAFLVNTKGTSLDHFAAYPPKLIEPIILCSTSEKGCCSQCGAPMLRQVERPKIDASEQYGGKYGNDPDHRIAGSALKAVRAARALGGAHDNPFPPPKTVGWKASCSCPNLQTVPCTVLDPFHGTGTTCAVAVSLGRNYLGCEISPEYFKLSDVRDGQTALSIL